MNEGFFTVMDDVAAPDVPDRPQAKVFISYSRKDLAFVDRLEAALKDRGITPLIDRTEIYAFDEWWKRIENVIGQADTFVFVISPYSVSSEICRKEIAFARSLNKRLAPIVWRRVDDRTVPEELARINYLFFDSETGFDDSADRLAEALTTDIAWVRKHTEFGEAARRWATAGRPGPRGLLLHSPALEEAEEWIKSRPGDAPAPTEDMEAFIAESRRAATRRRNVLTASLAAGLLVALILAGWAYWQQGVAVEQQRIAQQRHVASLAELATSERTRGHLNSALRIAVHATRISFGSDRATEAAASARAALAAAVWQSNWRQLLMVRGLNNISAEFSPDGLHILTTSSDPEKKIQPYTARIWDAISGKELTDIPGNEGRFWLSPDGSRIVAKSNLRTLRTWAFPSGAPLAVLKGHEGEVFTAKFNHDGSRVVTASSDKTARIWDSTTGTELATLGGHADGVWNAVFNPSGNRVVTGSSDKTARIWDTATGKELAVLRGHQAVVNFLSFSPDGMKIVTGSSDYTARIWDVTSATEIKTLQHGAQVTAVTFSPDSSRVLTSSWDKTARIWDATTGKELAVLRGHEEWINSASYNRHGSQITTASNDWTARTWNPETGHEIAVLRGHSSSVFSANFSPDGNRIVTAGTGEIRIWDADSGKERSLLVGHDGSVQSAIFSPDGSRAVTSSNDDKSVRVWEAATGEQLMVLSTNVEINARPFFSADGKRVFIPGVATIGSDGIEGEVRTDVWDTMTGNKLLSLPGRAISFSRDGSRLFGTVKISREGEKDYTEVRVWDAATGKEVSTFNVGDLYVLSFSADGTRFAYYLPDGDSVGIWDVSSGKQLAVLKGHRKTVQSATFSPDGSLIVTTSFDFTARIWQAVTGKEVALLRHRDNVMSGSFTPDGKRIVTAAHDGKARIWDVASGTEIAAVAHATHHATFSPDGSSMVTASGKTARIWDVRFATMSTDDLLMEICLRRLQGLTMLTPDEMRMSGYPDNLPLIDVCDGIN